MKVDSHVEGTIYALRFSCWNILEDIWQVAEVASTFSEVVRKLEINGGSGKFVDCCPALLKGSEMYGIVRSALGNMFFLC
ncbi:hypothetical protein L873DRAFT_232011 [Choiromyces venosus 120613-1]|uniref:Uncharacterized protein n=1 Tax=Choiromyces venosus 120613-1 TaxID=1336337 RepID=A0A3N4JYK6_9PEZI|nr:hypothetical protein L873DRAFT_232011 [Choiromyces venosus 120613-1]